MIIFATDFPSSRRERIENNLLNPEIGFILFNLGNTNFVQKGSQPVKNRSLIPTTAVASNKGASKLAI